MGVAPKFTNPNTSDPYFNVMGILNLHMKKNPDDSDTSPPFSYWPNMYNN